MSLIRLSFAGRKNNMNLFLIKKTLLYRLVSGHKYGHRIHSPFVFDLICSVFRASSKVPAFKMIEKRRKQLLADSSEITIEDMGAGSKQNASNIRTIQYVARTSATSGKYAHLLYHLVEHYKPETIVEMGTSLGIGTAYLATGNTNAKLITLEGSHSIAEKARETFRVCNLSHVEVVEGNFNQTLSPVLESLKRVDFAFIDGNHTKEATLRYFEQIVPYCTSKSILVFDDISWSEGMNEAWNTIIADECVRVSIDVGKLGIVFFREGIVKQNFVIRY